MEENNKQENSGQNNQQMNKHSENHSIKEKEKQNETPQIKKNWHDKYYKVLLLIPLAIFIFSVIYMFIFYSQNNDFIKKDISLTGGTSLTIYGNLDKIQLENFLSDKLTDLNIREIYDIITREQKAVIIETTSDGDTTKIIIEEYLGYELNEQNSSFEFTGSALSQTFYKQLLIALLIAFVFMGIVIFIIFRTFVPSTAVIISAFADIFMTLVLFNLLGMEMSTAGIVALLMLIGYSVDSDILLTNRALKRKDISINERVFGAFKTGMTMTLTSLFAVFAALMIVRSFSATLSQIFTILVIGLIFDLVNTWITNVSLLKWYLIKKEGQK